MNWQIFKGKWSQVRGQVKAKFGKLTDDDLMVISGEKDKFIGKLQERYGYSLEESQKHAEKFIDGLDDQPRP